MHLLRELSRDEDGAALIEYTVLLGIMLVGVITTVAMIGEWLSDQWTALNSKLK